MGIDIVEIERAGFLCGLPAERARRVFAREEMMSRTPRALGRAFACKEAVFKALGLGWGQGIQWTDVKLKRDRGRGWSVALAGSGLETLRRRGGRRVAISLSEDRHRVIAQATLFP